MSIGTLLKKNLKSNPRKYQIQGIRFIEKRNGRALICDEMGLGKTYQVIGWTAIKQLKKDISVLIICPSQVKYQWQNMMKDEAKKSTEILEGRTPYLYTEKISIINYEILQYWIDFLLLSPPDLIVIDECQYVKNPKSKRTKATYTLSKKSKYIIGLSGTPILNRPVEFFPVLNMIDSKEFPSFWKYAFRYCNPKRRFRGKGWDFNGATKLDELHERVSKIMIRRLAKEVLKELPKEQKIIIPVSIDNRKEYEKANENFKEWMEENGGEEAVLKAKKAIALVKKGKLRNLIAEGKLKIAYKWIDDWLDQNSDSKLVIFCVHHNIIDQLYKQYPYSAVIHGRITGKKREEQKEKFLKDKKSRLLIGNMKTLGVGVDGLQATSHTVLFLEIGWTPADHDQAIARILRSGIKSDIMFTYFLLGKGTIEEEDYYNLIEPKRKICDNILDGG